MTRRGFLGGAIGAIAGFIGLVLSIPLLGYAILPTLRKEEGAWSEVGPIGALETDHPKELEVIRSTSSGWMKSESVRSIWAFKQSGGEVVVYAPNCPHLGCAYRWEDEKGKFFCPCHNSVFDLSGKVLAGPAPRPLDTLPVKVEGDRLFVLYKEFKVGTARKKEA